MKNENNVLKTDLNKQKIIQRGLIILALLFGFCFILYSILSLRTEGADNNISWGVLSFDTMLRDAVLETRNPVTTGTMRLITWFGNPNNIIGYCMLMVVIPRTRLRYGFPLSIAAAISVFIQTEIKTTVMRPRPDMADFLISQGGFSFPSGHSCTVLVFFWFLAFLVLENMKNRRVAHIFAGICIVIVPLIGFSRVYLGVHYPTDILGGWCLGTIFLLVAISIYEIARHHWNKRKSAAVWDPETITVENKAEEEEYGHRKD